MKRRNSYYHHYFGRPAKLKQTLLGIFLSLSHFFRVPIEVITRKNLGERYFNILLSGLIGLGLFILPYFGSRSYDSINWGVLFGTYGTWYVYTAFYLYSVYQRYKEIRTLPSVWDFKRFSLSEGKPIALFSGIKIGEEPVNPKLISTVLEPGLFLLAGVILTVMMQPIGIIFIACAVVYSLGYVAAYYMTDQFVMDKIDQMICSEEMERIFLHDEEPERGFEFHAKRPNDPVASKRLFEDYFMEAEVEDADFEIVK